MQAKYVLRRKLVKELFELDEEGKPPPCARCGAKAEEPHEPLTRARGGSILDRKNVVLLCHLCHRWVHAHPAQAKAEGFLQSRQTNLAAPGAPAEPL